MITSLNRYRTNQGSGDHVKALNILPVLLAVFLICGNGTASAACRINVEVLNKTGGSIAVLQGWVRTRNGTWKYMGEWSRATLNEAKNVAHNDSWRRTYKASLGCRAKRQFRVTYKCKASDTDNNPLLTVYHPRMDADSKYLPRNTTDVTIVIDEC